MGITRLAPAAGKVITGVCVRTSNFILYSSALRPQLSVNNLKRETRARIIPAGSEGAGRNKELTRTLLLTASEAAYEK